jgi:hypothetical protein
LKIECFRTLLTSSILARGPGKNGPGNGCLKVYFPLPAGGAAEQQCTQ